MGYQSSLQLGLGLALENKLTFSLLPYSGKLWRALNLANQSFANALVNFKFGNPHSVIMYEIILAGFKFGNFRQNRQFAKLKTSPKFPLQYVHLQ